MATRFRTSGLQMGTSNMDVTGSAPSAPLRAFGTFGVNPSFQIFNTFNVTSFTDGGVNGNPGTVAVNFTTALPSNTYTVTTSSRQAGFILTTFPLRGAADAAAYGPTNSTTLVLFSATTNSGVAAAPDYASFMVSV